MWASGRQHCANCHSDSLKSSVKGKQGIKAPKAHLNLLELERPVRMSVYPGILNSFSEMLTGGCHGGNYAK